MTLTDRAELWTAAPGYEGYYAVSDMGRVKSLSREIMRSNGRPMRLTGRVLRPGLNSESRFGVWLQRDGRREWFAVAHLVAAAFLGPRPEGLEVCHRNGIRQDDRLTNLYYGTPSDNKYDSVRHGTHPSARKATCPDGHEYDGRERNGISKHGNQKYRRYCTACRRSNRKPAMATAI